MVVHIRLSFNECVDGMASSPQTIIGHIMTQHSKLLKIAYIPSHYYCTMYARYTRHGDASNQITCTYVGPGLKMTVV
jgi:hypothetical protein